MKTKLYIGQVVLNKETGERGTIRKVANMVVIDFEKSGLTRVPHKDAYQMHHDFVNRKDGS